MPVHIEKSGDSVGCYHSGTNERTNEQGKIGLLSQCNGPWKAEMSKNIYYNRTDIRTVKQVKSGRKSFILVFVFVIYETVDNNSCHCHHYHWDHLGLADLLSCTISSITSSSLIMLARPNPIFCSSKTLCQNSPR